VKNKVHHSTSTGTADNDEDPFANADIRKWKCKELKFGGTAAFETLGQQEEVCGRSIQKGIEMVQNDPIKYLAITYQTSMLDWPADKQKYTLIHRAGTKGYEPEGVSSNGWWKACCYLSLLVFVEGEEPLAYWKQDELLLLLQAERSSLLFSS